MQNVYLVQMESVPSEKARNLAHAVSLVESASVKRGGIILFPEMFATGYLPKDPSSEAENFEDGNGETAAVLSDLANKTGCTIFGAGIAKKGNAITNHSSVYVPAQQSEFAGYDKIHPFFGIIAQRIRRFQLHALPHELFNHERVFVIDSKRMHRHAKFRLPDTAFC